MIISVGALNKGKLAILTNKMIQGFMIHTLFV